MERSMTVEDVITYVAGFLAPHINIIEDGSGILYSGPITSIPDQLKKREHVLMTYDSIENTVVFRVRGE